MSNIQMASFDATVPCVDDGHGTRVPSLSSCPASRVTNTETQGGISGDRTLTTQGHTTWLYRNFVYNGCNSTIDAVGLGLTEGGCPQVYGLGAIYAPKGGIANCLFPCPALYRQSDTNPRYCEPQPQLTQLQSYLQSWTDSAKSCADLDQDYRKAVLESGQDPSSIPFPEDRCPHPDKPNDGQKPVTDPTATGQEGQFEQNASNGDPLKPADVPTGTQLFPQEPIVPVIDSSGGIGEPYTRLTITEDDLAKLSTTTSWNDQYESSLSMELRRRPTLADVKPNYLIDIQQEIPDFTWSCIPTQDEFDLLPDNLACILSKDYFSIYTNPSVIEDMRKTAPTIRITRDAPPTVAPTYKDDINERYRDMCTKGHPENKYHEPTGKSCFGYCEPPPPPPKCDSGDCYGQGDLLPMGGNDRTWAEYFGIDIGQLETYALIGGGFLAVGGLGSVYVVYIAPLQTASSAVSSGGGQSIRISVA